MSWSTIESDPGVFTELISQIGAKGLQVEEVYSLDAGFEEIKPVYGLIFLFKWQSSQYSGESSAVPGIADDSVFFASQVITNACATQAILSVLLNAPEDQVDIGDELKNFKAFTMDFPAEMRGTAIGNSEVIRRVHNSFARPEPFVLEERRATKDDDVYHFIAYVPVNGQLYELDGLKPGPICHGPCIPGDEWVHSAAPVIQKRIDAYKGAEIRFNLLAISRSPAEAVHQEMSSLEEKRAELEAQLMSLSVSSPRGASPAPDASSMDDSDLGEKRKREAESPQEIALQSDLRSVEMKLRSCRERLSDEELKMKSWRAENAKRRHNYVPFLMHLLRALAEKGELVPLVERAKEKEKAKAAVAAAASSSATKQ